MNRMLMRYLRRFLGMLRLVRSIKAVPTILACLDTECSIVSRDYTAPVWTKQD